MRREKSCGAVIYSDFDGERRYLIEKMLHGHYGFCKGHVEPGETEAETALREIREETGLSPELDTSFRQVEEYRPFPGCWKQVVLFLAYSQDHNAFAQPEEVAELLWLPYEAALRKLSHPSSRWILELAENEIISKKRLTKSESCANIQER